MGYYCRVCLKDRPNERFTLKGRKHHVCKDCKRKCGFKNYNLSKEAIELIHSEHPEIFTKTCRVCQQLLTNEFFTPKSRQFQVCENCFCKYKKYGFTKKAIALIHSEHPESLSDPWDEEEEYYDLTPDEYYLM